MKSVKWMISNIEEIIASILFCLVISLLMVQVITRYVFETGIPWSEELLRYSFMVMVYFAASLGAKRGAHFRITLLIHYLPEKIKKYLDFLSDIIFLLFNVIVINLGVKLFIKMGSTTQTTPILHWNLKYVYATVSIAFVFISIRLVIKIMNDYKELRVKP